MGWKINYDVFFLVSLFSLITWKTTLSMEKFMQKRRTRSSNYWMSAPAYNELCKLIDTLNLAMVPAFIKKSDDLFLQRKSSGSSWTSSYKTCGIPCDDLWLPSCGLWHLKLQCTVECRAIRTSGQLRSLVVKPHGSRLSTWF